MYQKTQKGQGAIWIILIIAIVAVIVFWIYKKPLTSTSNVNNSDASVSAKLSTEPTSTITPTKSIESVGYELIEINSEVKTIDSVIDDVQAKTFQEEVGRRLSLLNPLIKKIEELKNISVSEKETLKTQVTEETKSLEAIIVNIGDESSASALKQGKKIVVSSYRIFALYVPKVQIIAHADKIISVSDSMMMITSDPALISQINDAKAKAQKVIELVSPLTTENYPGFRTTFKNARDLLKTARVNLNLVYSILKGNNKVSTTEI